MSFFVNSHPLHKEIYLMESESCTELWVWRYFQRNNSRLLGAYKLPSFTVPGICFLLWSRAWIQSVSSWLTHNIHATIASTDISFTSVIVAHRVTFCSWCRQLWGLLFPTFLSLYWKFRLNHEKLPFWGSEWSSINNFQYLALII